MIIPHIKYIIEYTHRKKAKSMKVQGSKLESEFRWLTEVCGAKVTNVFPAERNMAGTASTGVNGTNLGRRKSN